MTTSQERRLSEVRSKEPLSVRTIAYYRKRLRNRLHQIVLGKFMERGMKQADIKRRIDKDPAQITKWLRAPGNWTIDTVSDLLIAMGCELEISIRDIGQEQEYVVSIPPPPQMLAEWLDVRADGESLEPNFEMGGNQSLQIPKRPKMELVAA